MISTSSKLEHLSLMQPNAWFFVQMDGPPMRWTNASNGFQHPRRSYKLQKQYPSKAFFWFTTISSNDHSHSKSTLLIISKAQACRSVMKEDILLPCSLCKTIFRFPINPFRALVKCKYPALLKNTMEVSEIPSAPFCWSESSLKSLKNV